MRAVIVDNGVVVNVVEASKEFAAEQGWIVSDIAQIGMIFDGRSFSTPDRWSSVESAQSDLISQINARRDQLETAGFPYAGLWFQSDQRSVDRLNSTALTASAALISGQSVTFPDWLSADNTPLPVDAAGMLALQAALTQHAGALHQHAKRLKAEVVAATAVADLESIDITAGWPGQQGGV